MAELAIIASDFPEIRKIVLGNELGLVVDPSDNNEIKKTIEKLIKNPELIRNYKSNSRSVKSIFSWEIEEKKLFNLLKKVETS